MKQDPDVSWRDDPAWRTVLSGLDVLHPGDGDDLRHPLIVDRDSLDLSQLRAHCRAMHHGPFPRANKDLASWHGRQHHQLHLAHIHQGPFALIRLPRDRGRPVGQIVKPLGNYTGQEPVTREELRQAFQRRLGSGQGSE